MGARSRCPASPRPRWRTSMATGTWIYSPGKSRADFGGTRTREIVGRDILGRLMTMPAPPPRFLAILWALAAVLLVTGWLSTRGEPAPASAQDTIPPADSIAAPGAEA